MSYNTRIRTTTTDNLDRDLEVRIKQRDWQGGVTDYIAAYPPFDVEQGSKNTNPFTEFKPSQIVYYLNIRSKGELDFILSGSETDFKIEVLIGNPVVERYEAFVFNDMYEESRNTYPQSVSLTGGDALGRLADLDYDFAEGRRPMIEVARNCLNAGGQDFPIAVSDDLSEDTMTGDPWGVTDVDDREFVDRNFEPLDCATVLRELLKSKGCSICQATGDDGELYWFIHRRQDLIQENITCVKYAAGSQDGTVTIPGKVAADKAITGVSLRKKRGPRKIERIYDHGVSATNVVKNGDFRLEGDTDKDARFWELSGGEVFGDRIIRRAPGLPDSPTMFPLEGSYALTARYHDGAAGTAGSSVFEFIETQGADFYVSVSLGYYVRAVLGSGPTPPIDEDKFGGIRLTLSAPGQTDRVYNFATETWESDTGQLSAKLNVSNTQLNQWVDFERNTTDVPFAGQIQLEIIGPAGEQPTNINFVRMWYDAIDVSMVLSTEGYGRDIGAESSLFRVSRATDSTLILPEVTTKVGDGPFGTNPATLSFDGVATKSWGGKSLEHAVNRFQMAQLRSQNEVLDGTFIQPFSIYRAVEYKGKAYIPNYLRITNVRQGYYEGEIEEYQFNSAGLGTNLIEQFSESSQERSIQTSGGSGGEISGVESIDGLSGNLETDITGSEGVDFSGSVVSGGQVKITDGGVTEAKLDNLAVSTAKIQDDAVTFAKIQDITGLSVIGRPGIGTASPQAIVANNDHDVLRRSGTGLAFGTIGHQSTSFANQDLLTTSAVEFDSVTIDGVTITGESITVGDLEFSDGRIVQEENSLLIQSDQDMLLNAAGTLRFIASDVFIGSPGRQVATIQDFPDDGGAMVWTASDGGYATTVTELALSLIPEIPNAKLANSTISGRELGTDLLSLSAGAGLEYTDTGSYNGSATNTIRIGADSVTNTMLVNSSLSVTTGTGLTGGGSIDLGGTREISSVPASTSQAGHVTTGAQSFAGDKTFTGDVTANNLNIDNWDTAFSWGDHAQAGYGILAEANDWTALNTFSDTIRSEPFTTGQTGWALPANGNGEFRNTQHDSIMTKAFVAEISQALFGSDILTKSGGELAQDFVIPDFGFTATLTVYDLPGFKGFQNFSSGDFLLLQGANRLAGAQSIWGTVTGYVDNEDGTQSWDFTTLHVGSMASQSYNDYRNAVEAQGGEINDRDATIALFSQIPNSYSDYKSAVNAQGGEINDENATLALFKDAEVSYIGDTIYAGAWALDYGQSGDAFDERTVLGEFAPFQRQVRWTLEPWDADNYEIISQTGEMDGLGLSGVSGNGVYASRFYGTELIRIGDLKDTPDGDFFRYENGTLSYAGNLVGEDMELSGKITIPDSISIGQGLFDTAINGIVVGTSLPDADDNAWFKFNGETYFNVGGIISWKTGEPLVIGAGAEFAGSLSAASGSFEGDLTGEDMALTGALVSNSVHVGTFSNSLISSPTIGDWQEDVRGLRIDNSNYFIIGLVEGDSLATVLRVGGSEGLVFDATRPTSSSQLTLGENVIFDWGGGTLSSSGILLEKGNYSPLESGNAVEWVDNNTRQSSIFHDEIIGIDGLYLESMTNNIILSVGAGSIDPDTNLIVREAEVLFGGKGLKNIGDTNVDGNLTVGAGINADNLPTSTTGLSPGDLFVEEDFMGTGRNVICVAT